MPESFPVLLQPSGLHFDAPAGTSILMAAQAAGIKLPSSCRNGTCRTCMCMMQEGSVVYGIEWPGLSRDEKDEGWILPCVAQATSALVLEAPEAAPIEAAPPPAPRALTGARR